MARAEARRQTSSACLEALKARFGERVSTAAAILESHGRDESYHAVLPPDAVAFPQSVEEIAAIVGIAREHRTPIIPFGAGTSLALALLVGGRVFKAMKQSLGAGEWIRRGLGAAVLAGVAVIAFGLDTGFLTQLSLAGTTEVEQALVDKVRPAPADGAPSASVVMTGRQSAMMSANPAMMMKGPSTGATRETLPVEGRLPSLSGAVDWLNSPPLTAEGLRGKVFWLAFLTAAMSAFEALLFAVLGRVVDWLGGIRPEQLWAERGGALAWLAVALAGSIVVVALQTIVKHQTLAINLPMRLRWNFHRLMLGQSMAF